MEEDMKEKKHARFALISSIFFIMAVIAVVVMGYAILELCKEKEENEEKILNLSNTIIQLNDKVSKPQEITDINISNEQEENYYNVKIVNAFEHNHKDANQDTTVNFTDKLYLLENSTFKWEEHGYDSEQTRWGSYYIDNNILYLTAFGYEGNGSGFPGIECLMDRNETFKFTIKNNNLYDFKTGELLYSNNNSLKNDKVKSWFSEINERYQYVNRRSFNN